MTRAQRKTHALLWTAFALLIPLGLALCLAARPPALLARPTPDDERSTPLARETHP